MRRKPRKTGNTSRTVDRVARLLKKHSVSSPPVPVKEIAEREGIVVRFQPLHGKGDVSAVLKRNNSGAVIGVNSAHSTTRQRFSIAHELGHFFLHTKEKLFVDFGERLRMPPSLQYRDSLSSQATNKEEIDANIFAANLLMPRSMIWKSFTSLLNENPEIEPDDAVQRLAGLFHVSQTAMEFRLLNLGYLVKLDE